MHAWPVLMASPSGAPSSSRFRCDRAHFLSSGRFCRCSSHVCDWRGVVFTLPCQLDGLICVLSLVHITLSAFAGGLCRALVCCLWNLSCHMMWVSRGMWTCHSWFQWYNQGGCSTKSQCQWWGCLSQGSSHLPRGR